MKVISLGTSTDHLQQVLRKSIVNIHTGFLTEIQKSDSSSLKDAEELDDFEEYDGD